VKVTADDIAQLLAAAAPRRVPPRVQRAALGGGAGWFLPAFGFVFGSFGMLFVWAFFPWQIGDDWRLEASGTVTTGMVRQASETNMSINDTKVMEYFFDYTAADGLQHAATCYVTGAPWRSGTEVKVRYLDSQPAIARIEGARRSKGGGISGMLVLIFPLVGYGMVGWFATTARRTHRLLREGRVAEVDVQAVDATQMRINYQTVYRVTLSAPPETDGRPVVVKRWARPEINLLTQHALKKQPIFVLYDPRRPKGLIFPEALIEP